MRRSELHCRAGSWCRSVDIPVPIAGQDPNIHPNGWRECRRKLKARLAQLTASMSWSQTSAEREWQENGTGTETKTSHLLSLRALQISRAGDILYDSLLIFYTFRRKPGFILE